MSRGDVYPATHVDSRRKLRRMTDHEEHDGGELSLDPVGPGELSLDPREPNGLGDMEPAERADLGAMKPAAKGTLSLRPAEQSADDEAGSQIEE